ncbi:MAG: Rieske 2Fe-2S domain-containing protein [Polyangiaceae bacterium]|nr:Rieske 2Fe-2S domain-containing protein [Polyangiaceae bacterium]
MGQDDKASRRLDPAVDGSGAGALVGPLRDVRDETEISQAPDGAPRAQQPEWRRDFPIDWPIDQYVARRDFAKFLVLTSGAFAAGQAWIAAQDLVRSRRTPPPRLRVASAAALARGSAVTFQYPTPHDPCLLIRTREGELLAYSQACTHLSCAVVPRLEEGVLHCPCHEGFFDLKTGRNIAGPPPRPLPKINLVVEGDDVFAVGVDERTV